MSMKWISNMSIAVDPVHERRSSIICTIGPDTMSVEKLTELRKAGMNVVRLNFSHGEHSYHQSVIDNVRKSVKDHPFGMPVAIALDTKGPEIRTGFQKNGGLTTYNKDSIITITNKPEFEKECDEKTLYVDYPGLVRSLSVGKEILVEDGNIAFEVVEIVDGNSLRARAMSTHALSSRKNVNLPGTDVDLPAISEKDRLDLLFAVENDLDMIFASFIRSAKDIETIRGVLGEKGRNIKIIAKIENQQGIKNFDEILVATDGVMVARGDLGMEIPLEKVAVAQKMMISKCNIAGKPVICATQMLESMTYNARPTRAEVSDVSNAILDGADCVMLSGETAKGKYPIEAVQMMHRCAREAESVMYSSAKFLELRELSKKPLSVSESVACAAVSTTFEQDDIAAIFVLTTSGASAAYVSKFRPRVPIVVITRSLRVARQAHLMSGCFPVTTSVPACSETLIQWQENVDSRIREAVVRATELKLIPHNCKIIAVQGWCGGSGKTNTMRVLDTKTILEKSPCC